jgi:surfactin synthase thioesterase subunit
MRKNIKFKSLSHSEGRAGAIGEASRRSAALRRWTSQAYGNAVTTMFEAGKWSVGTPWLVRFRDAAQPAARLICFPFGGGSAAYFARWARRIGNDVDLVAVQYPGRCSRASEPGFENFELLVDAAVDAIAPLLDDGKVIFFGHSFGALVAFEAAHRLCERGLSLPDHLFVSACEGPSVTGVKGGLFDDEELKDLIRRLGGLTEEAMADESVLSAVIPGFRVDLAALGTWLYRHRTPLPISIAAMGGTEDPVCSIDNLAAWRQETSDRFACHLFSGGHFYLNDHGDAVLCMIMNAVGLELPDTVVRQGNSIPHMRKAIQPADGARP